MSKRASIVLWTLGVVIVIFLAWHIFISVTIRQEIDEQILQLSNTLTVSYKKCHINPFNHQVTLHNLVVTTIEGQKEFLIEKLILKENFIAVQGLVIDIDDDDSRADYIRKLGYHGKIPINLFFKTQWGSDLSLSAQLRISVPDLGIVALTGHFHNIPLLNEHTFFHLSTYASIMVEELSLTYTDKSYIRRALTEAAKKQSITVEKKKSEIISVLDGAAQKASDSFRQQSLESLKRFIESPDTISLYIHPDSPKTIKEIVSHSRDIHYISDVLHAKIATK